MSSPDDTHSSQRERSDSLRFTHAPNQDLGAQPNKPEKTQIKKSTPSERRPPCPCTSPPQCRPQQAFAWPCALHQLRWGGKGALAVDVCAGLECCLLCTTSWQINPSSAVGCLHAAGWEHSNARALHSTAQHGAAQHAQPITSTPPACLSWPALAPRSKASTAVAAAACPAGAQSCGSGRRLLQCPWTL